MEQDMKKAPTMVEEKTWNEFRKTGLFWWINMILHTFGWVLVAEVERDKELYQEEVIRVYPARTKFRGFNEDCNDLGYELVTKYMQENADILMKEVKEETIDESIEDETESE